MRYSARFVVVAAFFVTALVVSNIIAVKLVEISGQIFPAGLVIFPLCTSSWTCSPRCTGSGRHAR